MQAFVKLRELTLSYQLPKALASRLFNGRAQQARIELSGRNLKTWTKYTGLDPEVSNFWNVALGRIPGRDAISAEPEFLLLHQRNLLVIERKHT